MPNFSYIETLGGLKTRNMDINKLNLFGAYLAIFILLTANLIFIFRLTNQQTAEYWSGIAFMLTAIPIGFLIYSSTNFERPALYYIQLGLIIGFIIIELLLDYIFKVDFRHTKGMVIFYVMFFFAGTGGMIGVASHAGKFWTLLSIVLFLIMTTLAFLQRAKAGL